MSYYYDNQLRNYFLKDTLVDWLQLYSKKETKQDEFFIKQTENSKIFKEKILKHINDNIHFIYPSVNFITEMKHKIPIIGNVNYQNNSKRTKGFVDLLVRKDYLHLFGITDILELKDYVSINIVYATIHLDKNGYVKNDALMRFYKAKNMSFSTYSFCPYSFVIGKVYKIGDTKFSSFEKIGIVKYDPSIDRDILEATTWLDALYTTGETWTVNPPSNRLLYPNLKVDSGEYNDEKKRIAEVIYDPSMIYYLGETVKDYEIFDWRDKRLTGDGFGEPIKTRINNILEVNRGGIALIKPILPEKTTEEFYYIDVETINMSLFNEDGIDENFIYLIGLGWYNNDGIWNYKYFMCNELTKKEEERISDDFIRFLRENTFNPILYYWYAEQLFFENNNAIVSANLDFRDLLDVCYGLAIKGCFNFKLKSMYKALCENGFIKNALPETECGDGKSSMLYAWNNYTSDVKSATKIIEYNEQDCRKLADIHRFLME